MESNRLYPGGLATAIRSQRQKLGISAAELARRSGITPAYVSRIEAGLATPSIRVLQGVAAALNTTLARLLENGSLDEELAARLPLVMEIREQSIRRLLSLPDEDVKRGLLSLVDRLLPDTK